MGGLVSREWAQPRLQRGLSRRRRTGLVGLSRRAVGIIGGAVGESKDNRSR